MTGAANPIKLNAMNVVRNMNKYENNVIRKKKKKKKLKINDFSCTSLPEDIIIDILTKLPVTFLLRFRCVCKSWNNLFRTANFAKLQLDYSLKNHKDGILMDFSWKSSCRYLDHDILCSDSSTPLYEKSVDITFPVEHEKKKIVGSCNGLVCYISPNGLGPCKEDIIIFNPFTKDFREIPRPPSGDGPYGFGYDLKTDDYKIAVYHYQLYDSRIHIYSSKQNSWKTANIPDEIPTKILVFFNGLFHWVNSEHCSSGNKEMTCFDTANDAVNHFPLPQPKVRFTHVSVLGGFLCVAGWDDLDITELWIMKEYGVAESWTKMFTIYKGKLFGLRPLDMKRTFKNYATLLYHDYRSTYSYDINRQVGKEINIDGTILLGCRQHTFFGSLVSPGLYFGGSSRIEEA